MHHIRPLTLIVALCLTACEAPGPAPAEGVPPPEGDRGSHLTADGWGPLRIGMTLEEVIAAAGEDANPDAVGGPEPDRCDEFRPSRAPEGMLVMIENGRLTRITLMRDSELKTEEGLGVGDPAAAIRTAYGDGAIETPHKYVPAPAAYITVWRKRGPPAEARGIVYEIGAEGLVTHVHAGGPSIQYVEGCL